jgi:thioredoxin-related protein
MKKLFFLSFIVLSQIGFAQKQTLFLDKNYDDILKIAKTEKKPIALMFYANWCEHCKKMKNDVFTDTDVISYFNTNFICMAIDSESNEGTVLKNRLQSKFRVKFYPTFAFLDSNENLLNSVAGELKKEDFIKEGQLSLTPESQFNTIKNNFYQDVTNADNCLKYVVFARKAGLDATSIAQTYLKTKPESDWITETNWRIIANGINNIQAKEVQFINSHKVEFGKVSSPTRVEKKLAFLAMDNLKPLADLTDTVNYYKIRPIASSFQLRKVDSLVFKYDLLITENSKNWKKFQQTCEESVEKFAWKDSNTLIEIGTFYLNFIDDKKGISNAIKWSNQSLSLGESLNKYVLICKLYMKQKEFKNALAIAEKAKTTALNFGWKSDEIEKLILEIKKLNK